MTLYQKLIPMLALVFCIPSASSLIAQCETWVDNPKKDDAESSHSNYRSALKMKDYELAFSEWQKAYDIAPAADGTRDFHYMDGVELYKQKYASATDAEKTEYAGIIQSLYDQAADCYKSQVIKLKSCSDQPCYDAKAGYVYNRKGFDMFYTLNSKYSENLEAFKMGMDLAGNNTEYIVFEPMASILVYQFQKGLIEVDEVRNLHAQITEIGEYNTENNEQYGEYYKSSLARFNSKFTEIESDVFDCQYFKDKLLPAYEASPDDIELVKFTYAKLSKEGCDENDPVLAGLKTKYEKYAQEVNAQMKAEFEAANPGVAANRLYKEGDFEGALEKYKMAIEQEEDPEKRANYYFSIASIEFRKQGKNQSARTNAMKAAELKSNWGAPYMLVGDIYAKAAKSCGKDAFFQRVVILAAVDKYAYAKSIDPDSADEANKKIGIYNASKPQKEDGFMQGFKEGQTISTGCWINEKVKLRFAS